MAHTIETAKSGRAKCRKCKKPIDKGELRFGEEIENAFADDGRMSYRWYHLACGAGACPLGLNQALGAYEGEVENRDELDKIIASAKKKQKPKDYPYGELAPSGRSTCLACGEKIGKGDFRVAIEREVDTGSFVTTGAGYLHAACAPEHIGESSAELLAKIKENTLALDDAELAALGALL